MMRIQVVKFMRNNGLVKLRGDLYLFFGVVVIITIYALGYNYNWLASDDGYYAHAAERFLNGDIPHKDFHEIHPGYVLWINALAMKLFGNSLASMRIPLIIFGILQAVLIYQVLRNEHKAFAVTGMLLVTAMGMTAVPNPSANLYALFFCVLALRIAVIDGFHDRKILVIALGICIGLCILSRHLSGVLLSIGMLVWLFSRADIKVDLSNNQKVSRLAQFILLISVMGLFAYTIPRSDAVGKIAIIYPALLLVIYASFVARPERKKSAFIIKWLTVGGLLSFFPLFLVLLWQGSINEWLYDVFVLPLSLIKMQFISTGSYTVLFLSILTSIYDISKPVQAIQYLAWLGLFVLPPIIVAISFQYIKEINVNNKKNIIHPLVFVGPVYAVGAIHYEIAIYLFWSVPLAFLAFFTVYKHSAFLHKVIFVWLAVLILGVLSSTFRHPFWETYPVDYVLNDNRLKSSRYYLGEKAKVYLPKDEAEFYADSIAMIRSNVKNDETIFSFPTHPEWYFLTQRRNATKHLSSGVSVNSNEALDELKITLTSTPPSIVIYKPNDKYNSKYMLSLREWIGSRYSVIYVKNGFEFLAINR